MPKLSIVAGATSQTVNIFIRDSSSTTGGGLSGLAFNTASLTAYYALPKAASVAITLATLAAVTSAYSSGGFKEIDATGMPGWYRFDIPDAALASGRFVSIHLKGATNMAPYPIEIELTAWNNQDAVHGGLSALPNTACTGNASLLTSGTGTDQLSVASGRIDIGKALGTAVTLDANNVLNVSAKYLAGTALTGRDIGLSVLLSSGTGTGQVTLTGGAVTNVINLVNSPGDSSGVTTLLSRIASAITISGGGVNISGDLSATMKTSVEAAAWDATAASHNTAGTTGAKLNSAASAGDPWSTALPGAYAAGTAGAIVGALNGIVAAIWAYGTRTLSAFGFTVATASDTNVTAIKAKTDQLTFTVANRVDASLASNPNTYTQQGTGDSPYLGR